MMKNSEVNDFIAKANEGQQELLSDLRTLITKAVPNSEELYKWSRPVYATAKDYCYLATTKKYVTLGFFDFEKIEDPQNLIEGTGAKMRHIKIAKKEDIQAELFTSMLQQAAQF